jgi:hypothetical protein
MRASAISTPTLREADNELFDRGCDLVEAATAIRRAAGSREAGRAVPAVLGCIESAMQELLWASAVLEQTTADLATRDASICPNPRTTLVRERMHQGYANLQQALSDAQRASAAARALASRALAGALISRTDKRRP